ncbi:MAG: hypothetical protein M1816_005877 [Peltula sp. TS41687]|nr:MAG: hypothetical protein M1816_005877 [Peltula sp. TS41687]
MPDQKSSSSSPLLGSDAIDHIDYQPPDHRPAFKKSHLSGISNHSTESTPLLSSENDRNREREYSVASSRAASSLRSLQDGPSQKRRKGLRWPTILALSILSSLLILIIVLGFFTPAIAREYAKQALVLEPTDVSIESFTSDGVRARLQATVGLDASRVRNGPVRNLGRAATWIAKEVECKESRVQIYVPEYGNVLLGVATIPRIVLNIRNGYQNDLDILSDLEPGDMDGIKTIANDWLEGRLGQLRVQGKATIGLKSGLLSLGTQSISESFVFEGHDLPAIPEHNITSLSVHEAPIHHGRSGIAADASVVVSNDFPIELTVPSLTFDALIPNCSPGDLPILLGSATTEQIHIHPHADLEVNVHGVARQLSDELVKDCPNSELSPLDVFVGSYLHGKDTKVYIRGSTSQPPDTPHWITELVSSFTVPVPVSGQTFDNLMKNFTLADVHLSMPNPFADPKTPEAQPRLSAVAKASIALPKGIDVPIDVSRVRVNADVLYRKKRLGRLDLRKWQPANSTRVASHDGDEVILLVESLVEDAPMKIINAEVFAELAQNLLFGGDGVKLSIDANVDVDMSTPVGAFVLKDIPARGDIMINALPGDASMSDVKVGSMRVVGTTRETLSLQATVNLTNPTDYSIHVPYMDVKFLNNGSVLGHGTVRNMSIVPGQNENIVAEALWAPWAEDGERGAKVAREVLSQFISGWNVTLTIKMHEGSIPSQPALGKALSSMELKVPMPKMTMPHRPGDDDDDDDGGEKGSSSFIGDATMHIFTSTVTFVLYSPFPDTTMYITHMNATAFYHDHTVGTILYDYSFAVPPGATQTPRLPVDWSLGSLGYEAIRKAIGGHLKLDTKATVGVRIGEFVDTIWIVIRGLGAKVRF